MAGFKQNRLFFNAIDNTQTEINSAVDQEILIQFQSDYDLQHIQNASDYLGKKVKVILSIDLDLGLSEQKSSDPDLNKHSVVNYLPPRLLDQINENSSTVLLQGIHYKRLS
jgi:diaminopimelate decarboxylase